MSSSLSEHHQRSLAHCPAQPILVVYISSPCPFSSLFPSHQSRLSPDHIKLNKPRVENTPKMLRRFQGKPVPTSRIGDREQDVGLPHSAHGQSEKQEHNMHMPVFNHNGHKVTKGIHPDGESGRGGVHPWHFLRICARSSCSLSRVVNILWPFVPAAIAIHFARPDLHLWIFVLNYIAMVPTANLVGFAGQELARKLPKVLGEPTELRFTERAAPRPFLSKFATCQMMCADRSR